MTAERNYSDILDQGWDELPEPKLLPTGSWILKCRGASFQKAKKEGGNDSVLFVYEAVEPCEDISAEALDELGDDYDFSQNRMFHRFWIEGRADWQQIRRHLEKHGVDLDGLSISESLKQARNKEIVGIVGQRIFTNNAGESITENTIQTFAAQE